MTKDHIKPEHEICEVLNLFPTLWEYFEKLQIPHTNITEGVSVKQYLLNQNFTSQEADKIISRLNKEINVLLEKSATN